MSLEHVTTERLIGRRLAQSDLAGLLLLHGDPRVMRTLSRDGAPLSYEQTLQWLESNMEHWERYGFGTWLFRDKTNGAFVGRGGLRHTQAGGTDEIELGYAISSGCWGQGFATEIARAALRVGFVQLRLPELVCFTLTHNRASQCVMEKAGFRYERPITHAGLPHVFYRLTAEQWAQTEREPDK